MTSTLTLKPARLDKRGRKLIPAKARSKAAFEQAAADLEAAAASIEKGNWCRGTVLAADGRMCALGHLTNVAMGEAMYPGSLGYVVQNGEYHEGEMRAAIARELADLQLTAQTRKPNIELTEFNDNQKEPTPVVELFRKAAVRARRLAASYKR